MSITTEAARMDSASVLQTLLATFGTGGTAASSVVLNRSLSKSIDDGGNDTVNDYILWDELGRGAAGVVYLAIHAVTGDLRAIKAIPRTRVERVDRTELDAATASLSRSGDPASSKDASPRPEAQGHEDHGIDPDLLVEVAVMKKIRHPHIVAMYECIDDPEDDTVYLVMQYIPDGPIANIKDNGTCDPADAKTLPRVLKQLVHALNQIHVKGVIHGDIKPDNVLVDRNPEVCNDRPEDKGAKAYLADFGVARALLGHEPAEKTDKKMLPACMARVLPSDDSSDAAVAGGKPQAKEEEYDCDEHSCKVPSQDGSPTSMGPTELSSPDSKVPLACSKAPESARIDHDATYDQRQRELQTQSLPAVGSKGLGTPMFFSPELFEGEAPSKASDVWALGVTLYCVAFGKLPFTAGSFGALKEEVQTKDVFYPYREMTGEIDYDREDDGTRAMSIANIIRRMLTKDPAKRATAQELVDILEVMSVPTDCGHTCTMPLIIDDDDRAGAITHVTRKASVNRLLRTNLGRGSVEEVGPAPSVASISASESLRSDDVGTPGPQHLGRLLSTLTDAVQRWQLWRTQPTLSVAGSGQASPQDETKALLRKTIAGEKSPFDQELRSANSSPKYARHSASATPKGKEGEGQVRPPMGALTLDAASPQNSHQTSASAVESPSLDNSSSVPLSPSPPRSGRLVRLPASEARVERPRSLHFSPRPLAVPTHGRSFAAYASPPTAQRPLMTSHGLSASQSPKSLRLSPRPPVTGAAGASSSLSPRQRAESAVVSTLPAASTPPPAPLKAASAASLRGKTLEPVSRRGTSYLPPVKK